VKFLWGAIAGGLLVGFGVSLGKSSKRPRHFRRRHRFVRGRSGINPGSRRRLEREMRLYLREARELIAELRNPKVPYPNLDAEFIPGTPNASDGAEPSAPEATKKES